MRVCDQLCHGPAASSCAATSPMLLTTRPFMYWCKQVIASQRRCAKSSGVVYLLTAAWLLRDEIDAAVTTTRWSVSSIMMIAAIAQHDAVVPLSVSVRASKTARTHESV